MGLAFTIFYHLPDDMQSIHIQQLELFIDHCLSTIIISNFLIAENGQLGYHSPP